ncbi:MAG: phenylalanine--tRNA ligase subunit beta [Candidatus Babeliaceae bacterium]
MKLSLAWIFDHIKASQKDFAVDDIVTRLSLSTAEIESVEKITFDFNAFTLVTIQAQTPQSVTAYSPELKKEIILDKRTDLIPDAFYLVKKQKKAFVWATLTDFYADKEGLFPPVWCTPQESTGSWKKVLEAEDYIISLDNKAITHRPDLWSHRGFAREIAALFDKELYPEERFLLAKPIKHYALRVPCSTQNPFELEIANQDFCKRFAGIYLSHIKQAMSRLFIALRLTRINARPINALVDATNYVMFDIGQPVHAFDAQKITGNKLVVRSAQKGEKITLLDGSTIELTEQDGVVADKTHALSLAGIIGGKDSAIHLTTTSAFVESAHFDPAMIRKSATHFKKRTESSTRFEKNLDPHQNTLALVRYLKILTDMQVSYRAADAVESIGALIQEITITIAHQLIEQKLGMSIPTEHIVSILHALGFGVQQMHEVQGCIYLITLPTFRAIKDIKLPEDIVEEIGRFIGYATIPCQLPTRMMKPISHQTTQRVRALKHHCAFALSMHEVYNYALFDEEFLHSLKWHPHDAPILKNPVSENWRQLVTALMPHLLKNVYINIHRTSSLRFFEWGRIWQQKEKLISEHKSCVGIFYEQKAMLDFYRLKAELNSLFKNLDILVSWQQPTEPLAPWFHPYQTAQLVCENEVIGYAGKINQTFLAPLMEGDAFIFELDGNRLLKTPPLMHHFIPLIKYQPVSFDMSILVPLATSVADLEHALITADSRISDIALIDFFEKEEWHDQKSLTFRITAVDEHKTMTHEEIESLHKSLVALLIKNFGAHIR